jgi:hypothetical protein
MCHKSTCTDLSSQVVRYIIRDAGDASRQSSYAHLCLKQQEQLVRPLVDDVQSGTDARPAAWVLDHAL